MSRLRIGIVRYASVSAAIEHALGIHPAPDVRIGQGRLTLVFRRTGASRWPQDEQLDFALRVAGVARRVLADDRRSDVRRRARRAIVVVYEDAVNAAGCAVTSRWECVIPAE